MKASILTKATLAVVMSALCAFSFFGCSKEEQTYESVAVSKVEGLTGGIAATVNGEEIQEDTITTWIQNYRNQAGLTTEITWAKWLVENGYTVESVRKNVIDMYVTKELIKEAAEENDIEVSPDEIDEYITQMRAYYESDYSWEVALAVKGFTEQEYRDSIELALLETAVKDGIVTPAEPSDQEMLEYAQASIKTYNGAKKSSNILFASDDEVLAEEVLAQIVEGELDFETAVAEYSIDSETSSDGGNVGWDVLNSSLVLSYLEALENLEVGQISDLVVSEYGIYIIKCTSIFVAPETVTSLDQIPEEFVEIITSTLKTSKKNEAYESWYKAYYDGAEIVVNEMPANVPYNIDLDAYREKETEKNEKDNPPLFPDENEESLPGSEGELEGTQDTAAEVTADATAEVTTDTPVEESAETQEEVVLPEEGQSTPPSEPEEKSGDPSSSTSEEITEPEEPAVVSDEVA